MIQKTAILIILLLTSYFNLLNAKSIQIDGSINNYPIESTYYEIYVDSGKSETIHTIKDKKFQPFHLPLCENPELYYWVRFNLDVLSEDDKKWVLEVYEHHIDDFTCYIPWKDNDYKIVSTGDAKRYKEREYQHINFVFDIHGNYIKGRPFYFRVKSLNRIWGITSHVRTNSYYTFYAVNEYFILGIFYGILFIMGIYNLLFFFSTKERVYVYYSLYIASFALNSMMEDGIGFAYLWSNKPYLTELFAYITRLLLMFLYVVYSLSFLKLKELFPTMNKVVKYTLLIYFVNFTLEKVFSYYLPFMYFLPFLVVYLTGIYTFIKGYKPARFFIAGSTFVVISIIALLARDGGHVIGISFINIILVYATNIGITIEILILSVAIGDRIRFLKEQEEIAREQIIQQLRENQKLKDKINLELESKVRERTIELENKNKNIFDSLNYALRIQNAVLPSYNTIAEIVPKCFIFHQPKDIVSGDFYWFHKQDNLVFAAAVDCTGHGVPGAFMSIMGSNLLHFAVRELHLKDPGEILDRMSFELKKRISSNPNDLEDQHGMDIALAVIDTNSKEVKYAGAFNPLIIVSKNREIDILTANRFPLGRSFYDTENQKFTTKTKAFNEGDCFYLFSDGFKDQFGGKTGEKYTSTKFYNLLTEVSKLPMEDQKVRIEDEFIQWKSEFEQIDDILVIGLKV